MCGPPLVPFGKLRMSGGNVPRHPTVIPASEQESRRVRRGWMPAYAGKTV